MLGDQASRLGAHVVGNSGATVHSVSVWALIAAIMSGCWWPRFRFTSWEAKSRYLAALVVPEPGAVTTGDRHR